MILPMKKYKLMKPYQLYETMACASSSLVNRNGPGSGATSITESIVKPAEGKTKCIECGDYECCCIPCTIL